MSFRTEAVRRHALYLGPCREVLDTLPENSVDAVVTDPPYGLSREPDIVEVLRHWIAGDDYTHASHGFMGKSWDSFVPGPSDWRAVFRVLRPGGHVLAFGGARTYDMMVISLRMAGFEVRDQLAWMYGSGWPKSLDVFKSIARRRDNYTTDAAVQWEGWGTALKPSMEPIVLARKPLACATVAANVLEHGTGGLNVDGCRIGNGAKTWKSPRGGFWSTDRNATAELVDNAKGRWPANTILGCACDGEVHDKDCAVALLDVQSGLLKSGARTGQNKTPRESEWGLRDNRMRGGPCLHDSGTASRFFYTAKASRAERSEGGAVANTHATVKPVSLIRYLMRLVTPPNGVVLDCYGGSGTGIMAAEAEGFACIYVDSDEEHFDIALARAHTLPSTLFDDLAQPESPRVPGAAPPSASPV